MRAHHIRSSLRSTVLKWRYTSFESDKITMNQTKREFRSRTFFHRFTDIFFFKNTILSSEVELHHECFLASTRCHFDFSSEAVRVILYVMHDIYHYRVKTSIKSQKSVPSSSSFESVIKVLIVILRLL